MCVNLIYGGNSQAWNGQQYGAAAGAAAGSVIPGVGTIIGGAIGGLAGMFFSGKSEDTSTSGWSNYLNSISCSGEGKLPFPSAIEVRNNVDKLPPKAKKFFSTYNATEGYFRDGDWLGQIVALSPVKIKWFKGANESFEENSSWYYVPVQPALIPSYSQPQTTNAQKVDNLMGLMSNASNKAFGTQNETGIPSLLLWGFIGVIGLMISILIFRK